MLLDDDVAPKMIVMNKETEEEWQRILNQCRLNLSLLQMLTEMFALKGFYETIGSDHLSTILACAESSGAIAQKFNEDLVLRQELQAQGTLWF